LEWLLLYVRLLRILKALASGKSKWTTSRYDILFCSMYTWDSCMIVIMVSMFESFIGSTDYKRRLKLVSFTLC